jgi:hypothetical protein
MKIALIQASLGGMDKELSHVPQSLDYHRHYFTDSNFPPRDKAMTPRLQAKIPKFFGWQLAPGYDYYLWLDGNIILAHPDALKHFLDPEYDIVVLRHPKRPNIRQEQRYLRKGLREQSTYLLNRYHNEDYLGQIAEIEADKDYIDDLLVIGGVFLYKNTKAVQAMLKEWWYFTSRYTVFDQFAFPYVLKKSGTKYKVLDDNYNDSPYIKLNGHSRR